MPHCLAFQFIVKDVAVCDHTWKPSLANSLHNSFDLDTEFIGNNANYLGEEVYGLASRRICEWREWSEAWPEFLGDSEARESWQYGSQFEQKEGETSEVSSLEVADTSCPAGEILEQRYPCTEFADSGDLAQCSGAEPRLAELQKKTLEVIAAQPSDLASVPTFSEKAAWHWNDISREQAHWSEPTQDSAAIVKREERRLSADNFIKAFKGSKGGGFQLPEKKDFLSAIRKEGERAFISMDSWDDFVRDLENRVKVLAAGKEYAVEVSGVSPFKKGEKVVKYFREEDLFKGLNFYPWSCPSVIERECAGPHLSLEAWLRKQAATVLPIAGDPRYEFHFREDADPHFSVIGSFDSEESIPKDILGRRASACQTARVACRRDPKKRVKPQYLGVYSEMPEVCRPPLAEQYDCFSRPLRDEAEDGFWTDSRLSLARGIALSEVKRILPTARLCSEVTEPTCLKIAIEIINNKTAEIEISYKLPLSPPLSTLLSRDSLLLKTEKAEILEVAQVGRQSK